MATSGTVTFSINRDQLIKDAYMDVGVISLGQTPSAELINFASRTLNSMLKAWTVDGLPLWKMRPVTLFLEKNTSSYDLGPSGDHFTESYVKTQVKAAAVSGATSLDVDSTTGMTAADYVGVQQDDGTMHWTTISSVTDSDTIVLTAALTDDVAVDKYVFTYTTKGQRPSAIYNVLKRDVNNDDTPINVISREEYYSRPNKTSDGSVIEVYFDPQRTNARLYVYPQTDDVTDVLHFVAQFPIEDMNSAEDDFDFPQEWLLAVRYNLALFLGIAFGAPDRILEKVGTIAGMEKEKLDGWDSEKTSVYLQPEIE